MTKLSTTATVSLEVCSENHMTQVGGGVKFPRIFFYKGVRFNVISVTRG